MPHVPTWAVNGKPLELKVAHSWIGTHDSPTSPVPRLYILAHCSGVVNPTQPLARMELTQLADLILPYFASACARQPASTGNRYMWYPPSVISDQRKGLSSTCCSILVVLATPGTGNGLTRYRRIATARQDLHLAVAVLTLI